MDAISTIERDGFTAKIIPDDTGAADSPREWECNLGTIVGWHPDYYIGDYQLCGSRGAVRNAFETARGKTEFQSMRHLHRYLRFIGGIGILPLYLYDHSGISISAGAPNPFDNPRIRGDHHGNALGWDTSMVGYIYTTRERIAELCGEPQIPTDPFYCPRTWPEDGRSGPNWQGTAEAWIEQQMREEVGTYNQYLTGDVYGYVIEDPRGEHVDSCWGFYGTEDAEREAESALTTAIEDAAERKRAIARGWALARVTA